MLLALTVGFLAGLSLIVAIGAQNAFVLRQGLRGEYVTLVVSICAVSDAVLILAGVGFLSSLMPLVPWFGEAARWMGALFLSVYGALRFRAAWQGGEMLLPSNAATSSAMSVAGTCIFLTWANPHVYLDTVILLGSMSSQYAPHSAMFGVGAAISSIVFFTALGFGARLLAPLFASPGAWRLLEVAIGLTMWTIALSLIMG